VCTICKVVKVSNPDPAFARSFNSGSGTSQIPDRKAPISRLPLLSQLEDKRTWLG